MIIKYKIFIGKGALPLAPSQKQKSLNMFFLSIILCLIFYQKGNEIAYLRPTKYKIFLGKGDESCNPCQNV